MKYTTRISVIIPCYNAQEFIKESINSVITQSFKNWELIIIDDASTDGTVNIIQSFQDSRIKLHCLNKNRGNYEARNHGLSLATGKYIAMLDADDISLPNRLQVQYEFMESNKSVGAIGANFTIINQIGEKLKDMTINCTYSELKLRLLVDNCMLQSSVFVRHHLLKKHKIKYNTTFKYASDYHFVFQCTTFFKTLNIPDILVKYRVSPNGITQTKFVKQQECASQIRQIIFNNYFGEILSSSDRDIIKCVFDRYVSPIFIETDMIERVFNKILEYNYDRNLLNKKIIYNIFSTSFHSYILRLRENNPH